MVILAVYTNHVKVKYKSTLLSKAAFLVFSCGMLSIILPFVFAYKSGGFWLKRDIFYEQPQIYLKGDYLLIATTTNLSKPIICSTFHFHKNNLDFLDVCSIIKIREIDENLDGKVDRINLNININSGNTKITSFHIFLPIRYKLDTVCPLRMQAAVIYQHYLETTATDIKIVGDLILFQSNPVRCYRKGVHDLYDYPVISDRNEGDEMENIIEGYWERNISTQLSNIYTRVVSGSNKNKFNLNLTVRYPEHRISYEPTFWQVIKWAWMQYIALYVVIAWLANGIKRYVFNNRLVLFYKDTQVGRK